MPGGRRHARMHPREFSRFRIVKLLPLGGMGRVYLAVDTATEEHVALKLIDLGPGPEQKEIAEAEHRGATLQARLCGLDNRVTLIRSYGEQDGFFYIEMEYVEGQDLAELLHEGPLGVPFAARIGCDICEVLNYAHTFSAEIEGHQYQGIVHGDIKPRNVRITPDGRVKVLDFGIAKALSLTRKFTTNQFGSSQYSSPERLNTGELDFASDLWAVGVLLYETVTAKPYFHAETGPKLEHVIRNYREHRPIPQTLPPAFQAILRKALHPVIEARYASARAFADDLKAFLENRPTVAETAPLVDSAEFERTRRTVASPAEDEAATRRTATPSPPRATPYPPPAPHAPRPVRKPLSRRERQIRFFAGLALAIILFAIFFNEYSAWSKGSALAREIESEKLTDMEAAWQRYQTVSSQSFLPVLLRSPRNAIQGRLMVAADRVIRDYRDQSATVSEGDWLRAQSSLARALELDPGDKEIRGKMYLCDAHVNRIRGTARSSTKLLNEARSKFEQAHELMSRSPDPYLGLARMYVYALKDVDRAEEMLEEASKRGHDMGRREKAQLADGYRERAERLLREADRSTGRPEEKDFLERSSKDFEKAENLYRDIVPYGGSTANLRKVLEFREHVKLRLEIVREGT